MQLIKKFVLPLLAFHCCVVAQNLENDEFSNIQYDNPFEQPYNYSYAYDQHKWSSDKQQNTIVPVSLKQNTIVPVGLKLNTSVPVSLKLNTSVSVSLKQNTIVPVSLKLSTTVPVRLKLNTSAPVSLKLTATVPVSLELQHAIVGGRRASRNQFPFIIALRYKRKHTCAGTIISARFIVTAAHCVYRRAASRMSVRAGSNLLRRGGISRRVARYAIHPRYNDRLSYNDIAVLRLRSPLRFSNRISAIPLSTTDLAAGSIVRVPGWGYLRTRGPSPERLRYIDMLLIRNARCRRLFRNLRQSSFCLSTRRGSGVCFGDSGGPAIANGTLVGVTSYGVSRCGTNAPDVFAKITSFVQFIKNNSNL